MYFLTILLGFIAITNALACRPVTCLIHCQYGFDVDTQGCPICNCRRTPSVCIDPISGYNCALIDRDCPSSHECQFDLSGLSGQCCLKSLDTSTASAQTSNGLAVGANTTTTRRTTTKPHTTTTHRTTTRPHTTTTHRTTTRPHTTTTKHHTTTTKPRTTTTKRGSTTGRALNRLFSG